jgi:hypothetical protein
MPPDVCSVLVAPTAGRGGAGRRLRSRRRSGGGTSAASRLTRLSFLVAEPINITRRRIMRQHHWLFVRPLVSFVIFVRDEWPSGWTPGIVATPFCTVEFLSVICSVVVMMVDSSSFRGNVSVATATLFKYFPAEWRAAVDGSSFFLSTVWSGRCVPLRTEGQLGSSTTYGSRRPRPAIYLGRWKQIIRPMDGTGAWRWEAGRWLLPNTKVSRYLLSRAVAAAGVCSKILWRACITLRGANGKGRRNGGEQRRAKSDANGWGNEIKKMSRVATRKK